MLQQQLDPQRMFQPALWSRMLRGTQVFTPMCDLLRSCYCDEDSHCAPKFACVASAAFPQFRVCKPMPDFDSLPPLP